MKVLLTGSSGMLGTALTKWLVRQGYPVVKLVRRPVKDKICEVFWDPVKKEVDHSKLLDFDAVIHLAGENVASGLWTSGKKKKIMDSRVQSTEFLVEVIDKMAVKPKVFISASGINVYGNNSSEDEPFSEKSPALGKDYLSEVVKKWEAAAKPLKMKGIRTCHLRLGAVLSPTGGLLKKVLPIFKFGAGGRLGSGKQMMSWIDLEDAVGSVWHCLQTEEIEGAVNLVAPECVSNKAFTKALAKAVGMPAIIPTPEFILSGFLGDMAECLMLSSIKCAPLKLVENGYQFKYPTLRESLNFQLKSEVPEDVVASTAEEEQPEAEPK